MAAEYRTGEDGWLVRVAQSWTEEKLMILGAYMSAFAQACKKARGWYALDLFAGVGMNYSAVRGVEMPGSALIPCEAGPVEASEVLLCEQMPRLRDALKARTERFGERVRVYPGDGNEVVGQLLERIPVYMPAFAFLDPEGTELAWPTVEAIADHQRGTDRKVEQLILFPTDMGFVRLLDLQARNDLGAAKVRRMYGHGKWRQIQADRMVNKITAAEARRRYVDMYKDGLRGLGYATVLDRQIKKEDGSPMYFLVFATDHPAGEQIMDNCFKHVHFRPGEERGQGQLFPAR